MNEYKKGIEKDFGFIGGETVINSPWPWDIGDGGGTQGIGPFDFIDWTDRSG